MRKELEEQEWVEWYPSFVEQNPLLCLYWLHIKGPSGVYDVSASSVGSHASQLLLFSSRDLAPARPLTQISNARHHASRNITTSTGHRQNTKIISSISEVKFRSHYSRDVSPTAGWFQRKKSWLFRFPSLPKKHVGGKPKKTTNKPAFSEVQRVRVCCGFRFFEREDSFVWFG